MTARIPPQILAQHLFAVPETMVYALLDGASTPDLLPALDRWVVEAATGIPDTEPEFDPEPNFD